MYHSYCTDYVLFVRDDGTSEEHSDEDGGTAQEQHMAFTLSHFQTPDIGTLASAILQSARLWTP